MRKRGGLSSTTRPNLDAHETGSARSRSCDSRNGEPPAEGSGDETEGGPPDHHPDPPAKRVDSPVRAAKEADQPPPDSGAGCQLSPAPGEHHQLASPRSTGHHRRHLGSPLSAERHPQRSRDRSTHAGPSNLAYAAARAQRALDDANQTIIRREARRYRFDEDIEQAKTAARGESLVVERAHQALAQSVASAAAGATAPPSPPARPLSVASQGSRPGDNAFMEGSVEVMASTPRVKFSAELAQAVVETASALLTLERPASRHEDALPVEAA